jgi:hypothetical protein
MLSNTIFEYLEQHFNRYLVGFDKSQMSTSLLGGSVSLEDVHIRPEEINGLLALNGYKYQLKAGQISNLTISTNAAMLALGR